MSYKPDESTWIAYLYGELEGAEKEKVERYLEETPDARRTLESLRQVRAVLGTVEDKEVIAPPVFIDPDRPRFTWNAPYAKTIFSLAASLLLIMVVGWLTNARVIVDDHELRISFGERPAAEADKPVPVPVPQSLASLSANEVQDMINQSLVQNNKVMRAGWQETQQALDASIRRHQTLNKEKMDQLVRQVSAASEDQIHSYVTSLQTQNMQMVKDYFQLTSTEQRQYIEELLVDFAQYLQQQRNNDLMLVETRLKSIEQNTDYFKQETEQILSGIISNTSLTIKN